MSPQVHHGDSAAPSGAPLAFFVLTCVPAALAYALESHHLMGIPWTEIAVCYGGSAFVGVLLGFAIRPASPSARRALWLSPFVTSFLITIVSVISAPRERSDWGHAIMQIGVMSLVLYLLMLPTAGLFRLTQWWRQHRIHKA